MNAEYLYILFCNLGLIEERKSSIFYFLNWSIADLQCCVSFKCTAKWYIDRDRDIYI